jgi:Tfp pilus assembly protein PilN
MPDWNKEIKLSDLFKRRQKASKEAAAESAPAELAPASDAVAVQEPAAPKQSFLKKEISFSRRRKEKGPKEAPQRKPSRAERRTARKEERSAAKAAKPSRAERRAAKNAEHEVAKAEKAARKSAPKELRRSREQAPPVPTVPIMRAFNLLPREDARDGRGRKPTTAQLVLAVVALLAFAALGAYFLMLNAQVADKRTEADSLRAAAAARSSQAPAPAPDDQANTELQQEQQARTAALAGALGRRVAWDRLLRDFSLVMPEGVSLTKLTASGGGSSGAAAQAAAPGTPPAESTFTIEGYTKSQETVALVLARLSVLPELSAVKLQSSTAAELGGKKVFQFVITTTAKAGGGATL